MTSLLYSTVVNAKKINSLLSIMPLVYTRVGMEEIVYKLTALHSQACLKSEEVRHNSNHVHSYILN